MAGPMKDGEPSPSFGEYPPDFFDFIVIDECHRGGANDESTWRAILEYFSSAVQLGLTATPKRKDNVDTYAYFGDPVYTYSLKDGINDGFLTPFKVKQISTTLDKYVYTPDDTVVEGEVESGRLYEEQDFNRSIEIREREQKRVEILMSQINQNEKTLVFCANQAHALVVRDLINQAKTSKDANYCQRVTADDGSLGDQHLRDFQDNEKTIPTILTTSQKLSTIPCVCQKRKKAKIKLADGKERTIQHMTATTFWHPDGTPISARQFMEMLFGRVPEFFQSEEELRLLWSAPDTRAKLLEGLAEKGFGPDQLAEMQKIIDAEKSDLFDVLAHVAYALPPLSREERASKAKVEIPTHFNSKQQAFLDFVLSHYVNVGVEELDQTKLTPLLRLKYHNSINDAVADLGADIGQAFAGFQKFLYQGVA